jgi:hypothetical protein
MSTLRDWLLVAWFLLRPVLELALLVAILVAGGIFYLTARDRRCTACFRPWAVYRGPRCRRCKLPKGVQR